MIIFVYDGSEDNSYNLIDKFIKIFKKNNRIKIKIIKSKFNLGKGSALKLGVKDNKKRKPIMKVNSVYGLLLDVQSGVGLAALPDYMTVSIPNLIRILPQIEGPKTDAHFVYPQSLKNVARVVAFRNFLYSKVSKWEF